MKRIDCHECGTKHFALQDFAKVYQVGISLCGDCSHCGARLPAGRLWIVKERTSTRHGIPVSYKRTDDGKLEKQTECDYSIVDENGLLVVN